MIRAGLAKVRPDYDGLAPPFGPGVDYPELQGLLGASALEGPLNHVYAAVRAALHGLGLDDAHHGTPEWNPLGQLVRRGGRVALKPNFIRHWNPSPDGSVDSVITHGSIVRAIADYAWLAVGEQGMVEINEAPQMDCEFDEIRRIAGLDELVAFYERELGRTLPVIDLRREEVRFEDGIIVERKPLPGDPRGYRVVDLGDRSFFQPSGLDPDRFRGADYDSKPTGDHHRDGCNEYLLSESVLSADLVVNLPKLKTHKKTGVTLALKNLVGINGDKNWLPHHSLGGAASGGDEFPGGSWIDRLRSRATEVARPMLKRGRGLGFFRLARQLEDRTRGSDFIRSGNWHGNQTTWRMVLDLNRCLYYSDRKGLQLDAARPVRTVLTIIDGIVAGEDEGPLAPVDRPLGAVIAATDPLAADLVALALMGFAWERIPKIREAMADEGPRVSEVRSSGEVVVGVVAPGGAGRQDRALADIGTDRPFRPHIGWRGHVEGTLS